uniref:receptor protein-tyrosine kinase n=1 Tax=Sarcoptes scabiei TaxID=52283 RepID=A0A834V9Y3_SARSC
MKILAPIILFHIGLVVTGQKILEDLSCDFNDATLCNWVSNDPDAAQFRNVFNQSIRSSSFSTSSYNVDLDYEINRISKNTSDRDEKEEQFLYIGSNRRSNLFSLQSPIIEISDENIENINARDQSYEFRFLVITNFDGYIQVIIRQNQIESQVLKIKGNRNNEWKTYSVGLPNYPKMVILLESKFSPSNNDDDFVAFNNLQVIDRRTKKTDPIGCEFHCSQSEICLSNQTQCNLIADCPNGDDENHSNCDQMPIGSYCSFDENFCSWINFDETGSNSQWIHVQNESSNGHLGIVFRGPHKFALISYLKSPVFDPIPLYHSVFSSKFYGSCQARFSYLFRTVSVDLTLELEPVEFSKKSKSLQLWRFFNNKLSNKWENVSIRLPTNFHHKYRLKFGAALGLKSTSSFSEKIYIAIDNFSLSKACFGIDIPQNEPRIPAYIPDSETSNVFNVPNNRSIKAYHFTSCGSNGSHGPTYSECENFYLNSSTRSAVFENKNLNVNGSQMWTAPKSGYYTIFAKGADGGRGLHQHPGGKGALVRAVFYFHEGDTIFLVIGQAGKSVCLNQSIEQCQRLTKNSKASIGGGGGGATYVFRMNPYAPSKWHPLLIAAGGGGGSGKFNANYKLSTTQHGQGFDIYNLGVEGTGTGSGGGWNSSHVTLSRKVQNGQSMIIGAEGGKPCKRFIQLNVTGGFGGGGGSCQFGGGGGGFQGGNTNKPYNAGNGGTSYVAFSESFLQSFSNPEGQPDINQPPKNGFVSIIYQIEHCCNGDHFSCLLLGDRPQASSFSMINHSDHSAISMEKFCICNDYEPRFQPNFCIYEKRNLDILLWIALIFISMALILMILMLIVFQYRKKLMNKKKSLQSINNSNDLYMISNSTDLQLSRLRNNISNSNSSNNNSNTGNVILSNIITECNPNYEFGGSTCSIGDLREIPREKLNLVKALGQGAFGEVYQGFLRNPPLQDNNNNNDDESYDNSNVELPVAVKTLPEYSASKQAEMDFLMEALIMSKFKHKNIVKFIGICFEKMPRFIVLELLSGGDLKTFLRENRGTAERPSPLVMGDLLVMALDVACGCNYLEENHFIHRDIAARNCLLTSKLKAINLHREINQTTNDNVKDKPFNLNDYKNGFENSGIIVKIADFGMARDIYRANYYRKGGKAMLPVKWMPPEAFLDGIFTSKTDGKRI